MKTEHNLPAEIINTLSNGGFRLFRFHVGVFASMKHRQYADDAPAHMRIISCNPKAKGWPDIFGFTRTGQIFWIECKRRDGKGKLSKAQQQAHAFLKSWGIPCATVTSVQQAREFLLSIDLKSV